MMFTVFFDFWRLNHGEAGLGKVLTIFCMNAVDVQVFLFGLFTNKCGIVRVAVVGKHY